MTSPRWGLALTTNASTDEVLAFCAHHLELGAHRIYLYLDDGNPQTFAAAKAHPKLRPRLADAKNWIKRGTRPERHQERQIRNINHAYRLEDDVEWLWHIDVDEFLWPDGDIASILAQIPSQTSCAYVKPLEQMATVDQSDEQTHFRRPVPEGESTYDLLGIWGKFLPFGFLSHRQGKAVYRTGYKPFDILIHSAQIDDQFSWDHHIPKIDLLHSHVKDCDDFIAHFAYRHSKGSYRSELSGDNINAENAFNMHLFLAGIFEEGGEDGLRAFYNDFCSATPQRLKALYQRGLLRSCALDLEAKVTRHFPEHTGNSS